MSRVWIKLSGLALVFMVCAGCSDSSPSWYDDVSSDTRDKEEYIKAMEAHGVDPREARADYEREIIIRNTEAGARGGE